MLLKDLAPASFRGAAFLVPKDQAEEGRNSIPHDYPGSTNRYIEDNGGTPPVFSLTCVLKSPDLPAKFSRLRRALNSPGPGTLQHPYYGRQLCQVLGPFQVNREDEDSGVLTLEVKFGVTRGPLFPALITGLPAVVSGLASAAVARLTMGLVKSFPLPGSITSLKAVAGAVADVGRTASAAFGGVSTAARRLAAEPERLALDPPALAAHLKAALRDPFDDLSVTAPRLVSGSRALLDVAAHTRTAGLAVPATTLDRVERRQALFALGDTVAAGAFAGLAEALTVAPYATAEAVDVAETALASAYGTLQELPLDATAAADALQLFLEASAVLEREEVRLPRIATLTVNGFPASVLAYELYDDPSNAPALVELNLGQNPTLLDGAVTVLERVA